MSRLTEAEERELLAELPKVMALPCSEYNAQYCAFCRKENGAYSSTIVHTVDCLGAKLFFRLNEIYGH